MLELEKSAFNARYTLALAFVTGSCQISRDLQREDRHLQPPDPGTDPGACGRHQHEEDGGKSGDADPVPGRRKPGTDGDPSRGLNDEKERWDGEYPILLLSLHRTREKIPYGPESGNLEKILPSLFTEFFICRWQAG